MNIAYITWNITWKLWSFNLFKYTNIRTNSRHEREKIAGNLSTCLSMKKYIIHVWNNDLDTWVEINYFLMKSQDFAEIVNKKITDRIIKSSPLLVKYRDI